MLLERDTYLDVLAGPPGRLILVGGEAGVGKTALVRAFAEGREVLWGACDPLHTPRPLGPLLDVADAAGGELQEAVAAGPRPAVLVTALLHVLRDRPDAVLVLEDVHWADEGTLDVLRLLGRRMPGVPALAIVTFRDEAGAAARGAGRAGHRQGRRPHRAAAAVPRRRAHARRAARCRRGRPAPEHRRQPVLRDRGPVRARRRRSRPRCAMPCSPAPHA